MIYLEDYIDNVSGLPENLQRLVTSIHELKAKVHDQHSILIQEMDTYSSGNITDQEKIRLLTSIQDRIKSCAADDEECALTAMAAHEVVNNHIARANDNYIAFCTELNSEEQRINKKRTSAQQIAEMHGVNGVALNHQQSDRRINHQSGRSDRSVRSHQKRPRRDPQANNNAPSPALKPLPSSTPVQLPDQISTLSTGPTAARALAAVASSSRNSSPVPPSTTEIVHLPATRPAPASNVAPPVPLLPKPSPANPQQTLLPRGPGRPPKNDTAKIAILSSATLPSTTPAVIPTPSPKPTAANSLLDIQTTTRTRNTGPRAAAIVAAAQVTESSNFETVNAEMETTMPVAYHGLHARSHENMDVDHVPPSVTSANEDNEVYCHCRRGNWVGDMIGCDEERCKYEWFHLDCVGMTITPPEGEPWYCPECRTRRIQEEEDAAELADTVKSSSSSRRARGSTRS